MFYSHAEKVRIAMEVLASCQAEDATAGDFLSKCQKRGITAGHRDTEDELFEFEYNVLRDVPGGKRAFKESLVPEAYSALCYDRSETARYGWRLERILHNLVSYTNAELACGVKDWIYPHLEEYVDMEIDRVIAKNLADGVTTSKNAFYVWRTNLRLAAYAAIAARPMPDYQRMIEMLAICRLSADSSLDVNRALNIHIGLFGYNERQTRAVMNPHKHYMYRIGTWMAVMAFLENRADIDVLGHYNLAFLPSCNVIRDLASGTSLPATDIVFNEGGQFDVLGRQVPFYYRQYYSAKEKLEDAYREMRGINVSL